MTETNVLDRMALSLFPQEAGDALAALVASDIGFSISLLGSIRLWDVRADLGEVGRLMDEFLENRPEFVGVFTEDDEDCETIFISIFLEQLPPYVEVNLRFLGSERCEECDHVTEPQPPGTTFVHVDTINDDGLGTRVVLGAPSVPDLIRGFEETMRFLFAEENYVIRQEWRLVEVQREIKNLKAYLRRKKKQEE